MLSRGLCESRVRLKGYGGPIQSSETITMILHFDSAQCSVRQHSASLPLRAPAMASPGVEGPPLPLLRPPLLPAGRSPPLHDGRGEALSSPSIPLSLSLYPPPYLFSLLSSLFLPSTND